MRAALLIRFLFVSEFMFFLRIWALGFILLLNSWGREAYKGCTPLQSNKAFDLSSKRFILQAHLLDPYSSVTGNSIK